MDVLPFPDAQEVEELRSAQPAELAGRQGVLPFLQVVPQLQVGQEVRRPCRRSGRGTAAAAACLSAGRSRGSWIDSAAAMTRTSSRQPPASASSTMRPSRGSSGQLGQSATERREPLLRVGVRRVERAELLEEGDAVLDRPRRSGGSTNGKRATSPRPRAVIWRMTDARFVRTISGSVNSGRESKSVLGVEADAHAGGDPAAAAGPLVGRRLRDRLDRQALHLRPVRVAGDAGRAGVDDRQDAGHGERGLRHVGGQHDPPARVRREDPVLLGGRQPGVEREQLGVGQGQGGQRLGGVADLPFARRGTRGCRPAPRRRARRRRRRSLALVPGASSASASPSSSSRPAAPGRPAAGSAPRPGTCGPTPPRSARRRSGGRSARCRSWPT